MLNLVFALELKIHEDIKLTEMLAHLKIFETADLLFGRELINFLNWPPDA